MHKAVLALLGVALVPLPAAAQWREPAPAPGYRAGQPVVLGPAAAPETAEALPWEALRQQLGKRNRGMLFWEAELEGEVATRYREVETLDRHGHAAVTRSEGVDRDRYGHVGTSVAGADAGMHQRSERFLEAEAPAAPRVEGESRQIRAHFMEQLRQGGVRFIDRALATRLAGAAVEGERPNVHAIETRALAGHADYLLQVTSAVDLQSASGRAFHVVLLDVADGGTVLEFHPQAAPPAAAPGRYVATANGFERQAAAAPGLADVARGLALETARRMQGAL